MTTAWTSVEGMRLFWSRALAAEIEVRLTVFLPPNPTNGRQFIADDFPEPVGGGYARRVVPAGAWTIARTSDGGIEAQSRMLVFQFSGPIANGRSIAGHILVDKNSGTFLGGVPYKVPVPVDRDAAGELEVIPRIGLWPRPDDSAGA